jgi:hypothetical protein
VHDTLSAVHAHVQQVMKDQTRNDFVDATELKTLLVSILGPKLRQIAATLPEKLSFQERPS